jgi:6-phosphofructokinase
MPLTVERCRGILPRGGTVIGTSRTNPFKVERGVERARATLERRGVEALVAIGGEGTLSAARRLAELGLPVVGVPKTIDNDVNGTDVTIGFNTAVQVAAEAIDRLHTTAESHDRVMVCEVMGRHVGWIALYAGLAAGAAVVLLPEEPFDVQAVCDHLVRRHAKGRYASIVVVAEGAKPAPGTLALPPVEIDEYDHERLGGIGVVVAREIESLSGLEARVTSFGHVLRGGTPSAFDRLLATRFGIAAVEAAHDHAFGEMVALHGQDVVRIPLGDAVGDLKRVPKELLRGTADIFLDCSGTPPAPPPGASPAPRAGPLAARSARANLGTERGRAGGQLECRRGQLGERGAQSGPGVAEVGGRQGTPGVDGAHLQGPGRPSAGPVVARQLVGHRSGEPCAALGRRRPVAQQQHLGPSGPGVVEHPEGELAPADGRLVHGLLRHGPQRSAGRPVGDGDQLVVEAGRRRPGAADDPGADAVDVDRRAA